MGRDRFDGRKILSHDLPPPRRSDSRSRRSAGLSRAAGPLRLPECDSARAKDTLADVFKQLKIAPLRFEPIKTISTSKAEVVCNALLPLADGASVNIDYRFFWQGSTANMKYSISRREPQNSAVSPPRVDPSR